MSQDEKRIVLTPASLRRRSQAPPQHPAPDDAPTGPTRRGGASHDYPTLSMGLLIDTVLAITIVVGLGVIAYQASRREG